MTLLEEAKKSSVGERRITEEQVELALAWVKGEINNLQVSAVLKLKSSSNVYPLLARALKQHINNNK